MYRRRTTITCNIPQRAFPFLRALSRRFNFNFDRTVCWLVRKEFLSEQRAELHKCGIR